MKIYKNLWAGYETYFVKKRQDKRCAYGSEIIYLDGKWEYRDNAIYALCTIRDSEHFPLVGEINLTEIIRRSIMEAVGVCNKGAWDEEP